MTDNNENELSENEVNLEDFVTNEFLQHVKGEQAVSSTMFDKIFLNSARVPKELIDQFASNPEEVEKLMTGSVPIYSTHIEKPYWKTQNRDFDRIEVDIFGAICLAAERHLLDVIIAHGTIINNAEQYTLRQVTEGLRLKDVDWSLVSPQEIIDRRMSNRGVYFHIAFSDLCNALKIKPLKKNKDKIVERLRRLSIMLLSLTPVYRGTLSKNPVNISFVDKEIITLLDKSKPRNGQYNSETRTDLIVNISTYYTNTLKEDGAISRKRLINTYSHLVGSNNIEDFYKFLDSNKRTYVHGQLLSQFIKKYLDNKISIFGVNPYHKADQMFEQVVKDKDALLEHFNIALSPTTGKMGRNTDYTFKYVGEDRQ